jgi:4-amino-4-deoxy-L-arabinose transferase-like glycosyltransferase
LPACAIAALRGFDGLYGQDAYAYFDYATVSVRDSMLQLRPLEPFFWPPGYPLLVALVSLATGPMPLAGQIVSLVMGALVPVLTALLVRELWPEDMALALLSGALVALCGQLWQSSVVVMADTTGLALATFGAWALVRYRHSGGWAWLVAASLSVAYAVLARWIYGLVAIPFALYVLPRTKFAHAAAAMTIGLVVLGPVVGPPLVGLIAHPADPASFAGNFQVYSWSPLNAFRRAFETADGHLEYVLPNGVYYAVAPANPAFFGPLVAALLLAGVYAARHWSYPQLVLVVGWAAVVYAFHAGAPWQNFRFALAYLPPLAVVSAAGILFLWRLARGRLRVAVAVCAALGLAIEAVGAVRLEKDFIDRKEADLALVRWVEAQTTPGAQLFSFGPTLAFRHYTRLTTFDLFDLHGQADLSPILATPVPRYLVLDERSVESQWLGQAPSTNFHLLRDGPGLALLGSDAGYTLYRVGAS